MVCSQTCSHRHIYCHPNTAPSLTVQPHRHRLCAAHWREEQSIMKPFTLKHSVHIHGSKNIWWMGIGEQTSFCHSADRILMSGCTNQANDCQGAIVNSFQNSYQNMITWILRYFEYLLDQQPTHWLFYNAKCRRLLGFWKC